MIYTLKNYQRDAVDELKKYFELYFNSDNKKEIVKAFIFCMPF